MLIAKLCLADAQSNRLLCSILLQVVLIPAQALVVQAMQEAGRSYTTTMEKLSQKEKAALPHGLPHHHKWNAMLVWAMKQWAPGQPNASAGLLSQAQGYCESIKKGTDQFKELQKHMKVCKVAKSYRAELKKIEVSVVHDTPAAALWTGIVELLVKMEKAEEKQGQAPPGDLETKIQEYLEEMS